MWPPTALGAQRDNEAPSMQHCRFSGFQVQPLRRQALRRVQQRTGIFLVFVLWFALRNRQPFVLPPYFSPFVKKNWLQDLKAGPGRERGRRDSAGLHLAMQPGEPGRRERDLDLGGVCAIRPHPLAKGRRPGPGLCDEVVLVDLLAPEAYLAPDHVLGLLWRQQVVRAVERVEVVHEVPRGHRVAWEITRTIS